MKFKKASLVEIENLKPGALVITDLDETISDFSVFVAYNELTKRAIVYDCLVKIEEGRYIRNTTEYKDIAIVKVDEILRRELD